MPALSSSIESFNPGQRVQTSFGLGTISAINHVDSIIYVTLSERHTGLYLFHPNQVEKLKNDYEVSDIHRLGL
jgi:hypothetical protein